MSTISDGSFRRRATWSEPVLPGCEHVVLACSVEYDRMVRQLTYSIVGVELSNLEQYVKVRSHVYDRAHLGMAPLDFTAHVWSALNAPVDPFP